MAHRVENHPQIWELLAASEPGAWALPHSSPRLPVTFSAPLPGQSPQDPTIAPFFWWLKISLVFLFLLCL